MQKITIYYGLSGTLKGSTIKQLDVKVMESAIKPWKYYQFGLFKDLVQDNDLTYGILHLVRLKEFLEQNKNEPLLAIERSISDCLFYFNNSDEFEKKKKLEDNEIKKIIEEERKLLEGCEIKKILLIQKDDNFIKDVVLKEPTRKRTFKNSLELYKDLQERYIMWTKRYNVIDEVIEIDNAKDYIERVLGEKFN